MIDRNYVLAYLNVLGYKDFDDEDGVAASAYMLVCLSAVTDELRREGHESLADLIFYREWLNGICSPDTDTQLALRDATEECIDGLLPFAYEPEPVPPTYLQILKSEYRNKYFYLYLFCWSPALVIASMGVEWWGILIMLVQLPFCFPMACILDREK